MKILYGVVMIVLFQCAPKTTSMNERITLTGIALNGKEGALIKTPDGTPYYIEGLNAWNSTYLNKVIEVSGILTVTKLSKDDLLNEKGEYSASSSGEKHVLSDVRYKVIGESN